MPSAISRVGLSFNQLTLANTPSLMLVAGIVVLLYDATLTFSDEVRFIWKGIFQKSGTPRGITKPKIVFLAARYMMCAIGLLYLYGMSALF